MKYILSILSVVFVLASCGERRAVRRLLAEADSLVGVCLDSALALLERADTVPLRHSERMAVELMRGKATTRAGNLITSDSMPRLRFRPKSA